MYPTFGVIVSAISDESTQDPSIKIWDVSISSIGLGSVYCDPDSLYFGTLMTYFSLIAPTINSNPPCDVLEIKST